MSVLHLRTRADEREPRSGLLLDWFGRGGASTISGSLAELTRDLGSPNPTSVDLLRIAAAVYGADKVVLRDAQPDRWRRSFRLHVPVSDRDRWRSVAPHLAGTLAFLTNDLWELRFRADAFSEAAVAPLFGPDAVSLFSGGLDSLAGAIDLLERGSSVLLIGHYDSNLLEPRQRHLFERLQEHYGPDRVSYRAFYLRLATANAAQARRLPAARESTTRSRSLLFIAAAGAVSSALGLDRVQMPENGYIGLNVPLEVSRVGACSTRTTHPHFIRLLRESLAQALAGPEIDNPYELKTKGEVLEECRNRDLLLDLAPSSVSCAHPEVGRWSGEGYGNCGYCFPCLMRRAALHRLDADDPDDYRVDVGDPGFLLTGDTRRGHLRALMDSISRSSGRGDILRSGPIPRGRVMEFRALYERGRDEIRAWLNATMPASR